jgi:hypothetical protein
MAGLQSFNLQIQAVRALQRVREYRPALIETDRNDSAQRSGRIMCQREFDRLPAQYDHWLMLAEIQTTHRQPDLAIVAPGEQLLRSKCNRVNEARCKAEPLLECHWQLSGSAILKADSV